MTTVTTMILFRASVSQSIAAFKEEGRCYYDSVRDYNKRDGFNVARRRRINGVRFAVSSFK